MHSKSRVPSWHSICAANRTWSAKFFENSKVLTFGSMENFCGLCAFYIQSTRPTRKFLMGMSVELAFDVKNLTRETLRQDGIGRT